MTITFTLDELRGLLSMPGITKYRQPAIIPAFITDSAFSVGDQAYSAVVTADDIDSTSGRFEITFDALGYSGPAISLTINESDIRAVREMLGIGHEIERPFSFNELLTPRGRDDLAVAVQALRNIADAEHSDPDNTILTWKEIALSNIDLAQKALEQIGVEADDGTPSDS